MYIFVDFGNTVHTVIISPDKCVSCACGKMACLHFNTGHIDSLFTALGVHSRGALHLSRFSPP